MAEMLEKALKACAIIVAATVVSCVLLVIGAVGALHSDSGARFVERTINDVTDGQVTARGLRIAGLAHISFDTLTVQSEGADQPDIELRDTALNLRLAPLLTRQVVVEELSVATLIVRSNPQQEQPSELPPEQIPATLPELPFGLSIESLKITMLRFEAPAFGLEGQYRVDGHLTVDRRLAAADIGLAMQRLDSSGNLNAMLHFGGEAAFPNVKIDFTDEDGAPLAALTGFDGGAVALHVIGKQQGDDFAVGLDWDMAKGPVLAAQVVFVPGAAGASGQLRLDLSRLNMPEIASYVGARPVVDFTAKLDRKDSIAVTIDTGLLGAQAEAMLNVSLTLPRGQLLLTDAVQWTLSATGTIAAGNDPARWPFDFSAAGRLSDNNLLDIAGLELSSGPSRVTLRGAIPLSDPFAAQVKGRVDIHDLQKLVPDLTGPASFEFAAQQATNDRVKLAISGKSGLALARGQLMDVALTGAGLVDKDGAGRIKLDVSATPVSNLVPGAAGTLRLTAIAEGALQTPSLSLRLSAPGLAYAGVRTDRAEIRLETLGPVADWNAVRAAVSVEIVSGAAQAGLTTNLDWNGTVLATQGLTLQMPGVSGDGIIRVSADGGLQSGEISLRLNDLAALANWPGLVEAQPVLHGLAGKGIANVNAVGGKFSVEAELDEVSAPAVDLRAARAELILTADMNDFAETLQAQLHAEGANSGSVMLSALSAEVTPNTKGLGFSVETRLAAPVFAQLSAVGTARLAENTAVTVTNLVGEVESLPVVLSAPVEFVAGQDGMSLSPARLAIGQGRAELAHMQNAQQMRSYVEVTEVALAPVMGALFGLDIPLKLSGRAELSGPSAAPTLMFDVQGSVSVPDYDLPLLIDIDGQTDAEALRMQATVSGVDEGAGLAVNARLPVNLNMAAGQLGLVPQTQLTASANGTLPLAPFAYLAFEDGSTLGGKLELNVDVAGVLEQPKITGRLCLVDGMAGIVATGTGIQNGNGCIALLETGAFDGLIQAGDGHEGRAQLNVTGTLAEPHFSGAVKLNKVRVLDGDIGRMVIDSAIEFDVALASAGWPGYVRGGIEVLSADLPIPENAAASVQTLNVVHINRAGTETAPQTVQATAAPIGTELRLDVAVNVPGRFFLRGRGVEAEWKGEVGVDGTLAAPVISGDIGLIKGIASAGAATLEFAQGAVQIVPAKPGALPNLFVNMVSESRVDGVVARMLITGPVRQPQIKFASEPSLPEDEILARLLFGKPAAGLTTSEALSLSAAALELSGAFGGGAGIMDRVRRGLGVDRLSIEASTDAPEQSKLSAGKYLTPDLYLSVRQGADGSNPDVALEYQLNENVTVTGDQKGEGGESVGIEYRLDY